MIFASYGQSKEEILVISMIRGRLFQRTNESLAYWRTFAVPNEEETPPTFHPCRRIGDQIEFSVGVTKTLQLISREIIIRIHQPRKDNIWPIA